MRKSVLTTLAAMLLTGGIACYAQQIGLVQNPSARQNLSLNGPWKIIVDPYEAGYYDFHLHPIPGGGLGADRVPADKSDRLELPFMPNAQAAGSAPTASPPTRAIAWNSPSCRTPLYSRCPVTGTPRSRNSSGTKEPSGRSEERRVGK